MRGPWLVIRIEEHNRRKTRRCIEHITERCGHCDLDAHPGLALPEPDPAMWRLGQWLLIPSRPWKPEEIALPLTGPYRQDVGTAEWLGRHGEKCCLLRYDGTMRAKRGGLTADEYRRLIIEKSYRMA
jgi:hypothetical protein